jgi:hypothetical protein
MVVNIPFHEERMEGERFTPTMDCASRRGKPITPSNLEGIVLHDDGR